MVGLLYFHTFLKHSYIFSHISVGRMGSLEVARMRQTRSMETCWNSVLLVQSRHTTEQEQGTVDEEEDGQPFSWIN